MNIFADNKKVTAARKRKAANRIAREEELRREAAQLGISVAELRRRKFEEVQDIRAAPPPAIVEPVRKERRRWYD